jgi:hypothetical protein
LVTWVYDEIGCAGALLDEFCIRNLSGNTVGWVFGVSMFSLKGEHIGWYEDGVMYDIQNKVLGFVPGAKGLSLEMPALAAEPAMPVLSKRPYVPTLRGRAPRPRCTGWSSSTLASYLEQRPVPAACPPFITRTAGHAMGAGDLSR